MKKMIMSTTLFLVLFSAAYAETGTSQEKQTAAQQQQTAQQGQQSSSEDSPSLYDSIQSGWNKFLDLLGAKKTSN